VSKIRGPLDSTTEAASRVGRAGSIPGLRGVRD
jgi:hypothetical protein